MKRLATALCLVPCFSAAQVVVGPTNPLPSVPSLLSSIGVRLAPGTLSYQGVALPGPRWSFAACAATPLAVIALPKPNWFLDVEGLGGFNNVRGLTAGVSFGVAYQPAHWKLGVGFAALNSGVGAYLGFSWSN